MTKQKTIEGKNLFGEARKYTFNLMDAETGLKVSYDSLPVFVKMFPLASGIIDELEVDDDKEEATGGIKFSKIVELVGLISDVVSLDKTKELAKDMLSGVIVEMDGTILEPAEDGIGEYAIGKPDEIYTALYYAYRVNFPKYIDPLLEWLGVGNDSSQ